MKDMIVRLLFRGDASRFDSTLKQSERRLKSFGSVARHEFDTIKNAAASLKGKLAGLGIGIGGALLIKQSATLDKDLTRIGQTADMSRANVMGLRKEFFRMSQETGQTIENLKGGFDNAVQSGLNFKEALPVTDAVNKAMGVTVATADQLTAGLTVAATAFQFDLATPGKALILLDKMYVAGHQGNAELENLSSIFARVGVNAARAGMGFDQTLGFIEGLSLIERQPERLATLADSTLRLFTNLQYLSRAQKGTGIKFFDKAGGRRDPLDILTDIKKKYDSLKTAQQKEMFMGVAFKGADIDTVKGLQTLLSGNMLSRIRTMNSEIGKAPGTIVKNLPDALNNAVDQTGRLKNKLREAADSFIQPMNRGIAAISKKLVGSKAEGGLDLSGLQIAAGGAAALAAGYVGYRLAGGALKKFLGQMGGTGVGIAEGKAIEAATGVIPVFVTNMPTGGLDAVKTPNKLAQASPWLKSLIPAGAAAAGVLGMSYAGAGLSTTTAVRSLADVMRGGSGNNWINDAWNRQMMAIQRDVLAPIASLFASPSVSAPEIKNNVAISLNVAQTGRMTASTNDMKTQIDLKRGKF